MSKKVKLVRGALVGFSSERTQYKPYGYNLAFTQEAGCAETILVEMEVPTEHIVQDQDGVVVLSLKGLTVLLAQAADAIDELDEEYKNRFYPK